MYFNGKVTCSQAAAVVLLTENLTPVPVGAVFSWTGSRSHILIVNLNQSIYALCEQMQSCFVLFCFLYSFQNSFLHLLVMWNVEHGKLSQHASSCFKKFTADWFVGHNLWILLYRAVEMGFGVALLWAWNCKSKAPTWRKPLKLIQKDAVYVIYIDFICYRLFVHFFML